MEEQTVIIKILKAVNIPVPENLQILQLDLTSQPSEVLIKLKNQLDFYQNAFPKENYEKYSKFLKNLLRTKRKALENGVLPGVAGNEFDERVLPIKGKFEFVVQGVSLWALELQESLLIKDFPNFFKVFKGVIRKIRIRNVGAGFGKIKNYIASRKIRCLALGRVLRIFKDKVWWKRRENFSKFKGKVDEKVKMIKLRQKLMEAYKKKDDKVIVKKKSNFGVLWILFATAAVLTAKSVFEYL